MEVGAGSQIVLVGDTEDLIKEVLDKPCAQKDVSTETSSQEVFF